MASWLVDGCNLGHVSPIYLFVVARIAIYVGYNIADEDSTKEITIAMHHPIDLHIPKDIFPTSLYKDHYCQRVCALVVSQSNIPGSA